MAVWYIISDYVLVMKACPTVGCVVYNKSLCPHDEGMQLLAVWYIISDYVLMMKACPTVGCVVYNK